MWQQVYNPLHSDVLSTIAAAVPVVTLLVLIATGAVKTHIAALPVPYRTSEREPSFQSLRDAHWHYEEGSRPFPVALDPFTCNRFEIAEFGREALALDIRYLGVCCGAGPHHIRALAEAVGKHPPGSKYSADMSKHAFLGSHERIKKVQKDYASKL